MNVVIMGSGRVGARLARMFDREGHAVTIIDTNPLAFEKLDVDFGGRTIVGTGIDEDVLKKAGIAQADVFLAVTNMDNPNIMASQIAKLMFHVPRVVARIYDPAREDTYHDLGLETICPTTLISQRIHMAVVSNSDEPLDDHEIEPLMHAVAQPVPTPPRAPAVPVTPPAATGASASVPANATYSAPASATAKVPERNGEQQHATGLRRFLPRQ